MLSNKKLITIFGTKGVGKSTLFWQLTRSGNHEKGKIKISPIVNHTEGLIQTQNKIYKLIDTPTFILSPKTEIEKGIKERTESLLNTSDLIC